MTTATLSPRASGLVAAVCACATAALSIPDNDNAGLAWRLSDDEAHTDDRPAGVDVRDRNAAALVPVIAEGLPSLWRVWHTTGPNAVAIRKGQAYSRSVGRRVRTLHAFLTAAGVDVAWM